MKLLTIILSLIVSQCVIGQEALMESIQEIRNQNTPENGKVLCTNDYWDATQGNGQGDFKLLCEIPADAELQVSDKQSGVDRTVLTIFLVYQGEVRDKIYFYFINEEGQWLLDGINESENVVTYFMEGKIAGHFKPTYIPENTDLEKIGLELLNHLQDSVDLRSYMQQVFTEGSNHEYETLLEQFTDEDYDKATLSGTGFDEVLNRGYLYFTQFNSEADFMGEITLYLIRTDMGTYKLNGRVFGEPSGNEFLH